VVNVVLQSRRVLGSEFCPWVALGLWCLLRAGDGVRQELDLALRAARTAAYRVVLINVARHVLLKISMHWYNSPFDIQRYRAYVERRLCQRACYVASRLFTKSVSKSSPASCLRTPYSDEESNAQSLLAAEYALAFLRCSSTTSPTTSLAPTSSAHFTP
jgi:hypothetical protein